MTLDEFRNHLADNLGVRGRGNNLSADDANYLETVIRNCLAELDKLEVSEWTESDIEDYAVESLVLYCRATVSRFGFDPDPSLKALGLMQLRYLTTDARSGVGKACYY